MVFLGFGMDLPVVLRTGFEGAGLAGVTIATTLGLGWMLGEQFDINRKISALISAGTAICGLIRGRGRRRARGRGVHANSIGSGCLKPGAYGASRTQTGNRNRRVSEREPLTTN
ncbi:MAG TPA: putative sulfate exporter family transporter, partial [Chthoniobacterales bacterium]|nr:putative sulfate exporter family transporter [Chthoniobacterales bacterium]